MKKENKRQDARTSSFDKSARCTRGMGCWPRWHNICRMACLHSILGRVSMWQWAVARGRHCCLRGGPGQHRIISQRIWEGGSGGCLRRGAGQRRIIFQKMMASDQRFANMLCGYKAFSSKKEHLKIVKLTFLVFNFNNEYNSSGAIRWHFCRSQSRVLKLKLQLLSTLYISPIFDRKTAIDDTSPCL